MERSCAAFGGSGRAAASSTPAAVPSFAPLRLPARSRIKSVVFVAKRAGATATTVNLVRGRFGEENQTLAGTGATGTIGVITETPCTWSPGADHVVRGGYRYWLQIYQDDGAEVYGVKIVYRTP